MRITVEDHQQWILDRIGRLAVSRLPVADALGLTLAEDVRGDLALPLWDNSAMDGYAVRAADIATATPEAPIRLTIAGEVLAGSPDDPVIAAGSAVRIMTGAPIPSDADAVIPVELTRGDVEGEDWGHTNVDICARMPPGANIRRRGEDVPAGALLAEAGQQLGAARRAALAAAGVEQVTVRPRPRVAVIATGSELRESGQPLSRGQIPESNSLLIAGLLQELDITPVRVARSADNADDFSAVLRRVSETCDVVITTGGVGPGTHDVVRIALESEPDVRAVRVAVRPGQPQCVGRLRPSLGPVNGGPAGADSSAFLFALPGNPVSAAASFELFVRPALLAQQGRSSVHRLRLSARATVDWRGAENRLQVLPVIITEDASAELTCTPSVNPRAVSHAVGGHGAANGYALVPADRGDVRAGEVVSVILVAS